MNKQQFNAAINQKETLLTVSENELREICSEFPYFSLARILLTGHYLLKNHFQFENSLKIAASQVNSRISIKNYMNKLIGDKAENELDDKAIAIKKEAPPTETTIRKADTATEDVAKGDIAFGAPQKTQFPDSDRAANPESKKKNGTTEPSYLVRIPEKPAPDAQKKAEEASGLKSMPKAPPATPNVELTATTPKPLAINPKPEFKEPKKQHSEFISNGIKPYQRKKSREELLAVINKRLEQIKKEKKLSKSGRPVKTNYPGYSIDDLSEKTVFPTNEASSPLNEKLALIDRFIELDPSISKPKQEFFQTEKQSERSGQFADEVISETLANILAKQGHLEKAVEMYQKLILKFPEKSSYFAALIKKIKNS